MRIFCFIIILVVFITSVSSVCEDKTNLEEISWIVGHWEGEAFGGICEEIWNPPSAGTMTGTFKLIVSNEVKFYEFMIFSIDSLGPVHHLKHFNSDLTGWEKKDEVVSFPFVRISENELHLDGIIYRRLSTDSLQIELLDKKPNGEIESKFINYKKINTK